jgi:hypothetical protein
MGVFKELRRMPRWEAIVLALAATAMGGWWAGKYGSGCRTGFIAVTTVPADATVLVDGVAVNDSSPVMIEESAGRYTVSVTRDGYTRNDQIVEVRPGRATALKAKLAASPDTGFDLISEPQGGLAWLDGEPIVDASGRQARTDFRDTAVPPGHHVIEIRSDRFKDWRQEIEVHPGTIRKVQALLTPRF